MLRLISKITFNQYDRVAKTYGKDVVFEFCESVEINSSFENFTDTAKITFPRKLSMNGKNIFFSMRLIIIISMIVTRKNSNH